MVEKRETLRTLSRAIASRLDQAMPDDQPGILSYDDCYYILCGLTSRPQGMARHIQ